MNKIEAFLANENETEAFGLALAGSLQAPVTIYMQGELGAGKTTLVRGLLRGLGHQGSTKSPTYTLVEPYQLDDVSVYHFDLYRLADPEELEYIGIREYQTQQSVLIFEWPTKGIGMIPPADLSIELSYSENGRQLVLKDFAGKVSNNWNFGDILCQNENE
ncbi:tRNA (adenosine(37)-N6)-threonylcarbamoyltransferase complex ATPase subunit type 1 TsaE [Kangiella sp. TOML190]|uniref:tRNA (adenosine(37)-N6)-threonylcarbamoyltransferase complex ATPase subunit type 1 TsaE n=1 Tax=Kangiella sp. TOML190 TaxID=2931351 RepID=UPI00203FE39F|nr:tRNA (adenosine(37)-N6)-threonylcarbamoyltransferase complex ATPase subunit type 1 TsaE [Kangiella sp. TOML190]